MTNKDILLIILIISES